jgi:hypothetical protein
MLMAFGSVVNLILSFQFLKRGRPRSVNVAMTSV